ncbi:MAG TPA: glycoside hydrolase family 43 protein [Actinophytocola sp.]|uniref:glycoside hydrolase family 43 protein n=1 Tax=Actinophytocola sp. TaxID=1872138 RepID=UPI002DBBC798|nr:glycoside hydrolase family 43 protein [Actinophytocola sp.]HEU5470812.1 glycoside hydrolase family 43 protein [Actinophytocola sp.]
MMPKRRGVLAGLLSVALGLTGAVALSPVAHAQSFAGYVMAYFTESPQRTANNYGLHLAVSTDSLNWTPLNQNNPVTTPTQGTLGLRDPYILRKQTGGFVILATDLNGTDFSQNNQFIHAWDSTDLRSFTGYRRLRMHTMTTHTWAPEAFFDPARGQYGIIYSAFNGVRDVIMVNYTTDFVTVSAPQVYFDPGFNVLDATMHSNGGTNYLYYKNLNDGTIRGARSNSLNPGSFNSGTYTSAIGGQGTEAPIVVKTTNANQWYLWVDSFSPVNGKFNAFQSGNVNNNAWTAMNRRDYNHPLNSKHATIQPITATELNNLLARWGTPAWNRLKSYNFPDRYVRHADFVARVDVYPFDPFPDQQWRMVPGLSDPAGVSFQSVNFPDRFLRHANFALRIDPNDNTAAFRADATFFAAAGWADPNWTSFRSANNPTRYLRHINNVLRIDPISAGSSTVDRQDATFRVLS